jgi:murein DD-endopeptidase MepM/ murein hydrolase activator NlpD
MQTPRASSPLFEFDLNAKNSLTLDLSAQNPALEKINSSKNLATYINQVLKAKGKTYALGGYAEKRVIYQRFKHFNNNPTTERNVHLGLDVWAPAHTTIISPADALVHSFALNNNAGDYGATIILEHAQSGQKYFSLHGHLSLKSIENIAVGQSLQAGEHFAELGTEAENGGWPPHLHFQLIIDIGNHQGDYPGVVNESKKEYYLNNCPNPSAYLSLGKI